MSNTRTTRTTRTQEPPPGRKRPKQDPANTDGAADTEDELDRIGRAQELLAPLLTFHKQVESARDDDLRIYWDVRVVRGQDSPFAHVTGSSSLPGALGSKMKALAPSVIQEEITEKIARPLTALLQDEAERLTMEELAARDGGSDPEAGAAEPLP